MKDQISLTIFFPAYNEEDNIERAAEDAVRVAEDSPYISDYEILIINDGSTDGTEACSRRLASRYPAVKLISHPRNRGYGAALKTGIYAATKDYIFFTDADRQFDMLELSNLLVHVPQYDAVVGYRAPRRDPLMRLINAWGWNRLNRLLFGLQVRDIDCAFKLLRRALAQNLHLRSQGAMVSAEMLIKLSRRGVRIKEVPVSHLPRVAGAATGAKPTVILRALREMVALYGGELGSVTHKQALKYASVGVVNTLLDLTAYLTLTRGTVLFSEHLVAAKFFSFLLGTVSSLMLNRTWTFGLRTRLTMSEVIRFYATVSAALVINVTAMYVFVSLGMHDLLALGAATVLTFATSFTLSKFWVFRTTDTVQAIRPHSTFARFTGSASDWSPAAQPANTRVGSLS